MKIRYSHAVLGGTFDHLHLGHELLISTAKSNSIKLTIGLVKSPLRDKLLPQLIEPYFLRHANLDTFIKSNNFANTKIIPLIDIYGSTLTDLSVDAIFVTQETAQGALTINQKRKQLYLPPLAVITLPRLVGDDNMIINSTRIRQGLISREGLSYLRLIISHDFYRLPYSLRNRLRKPLGIVVKSISALSTLIPPTSLVITVGDIVTKQLLKSPYQPALSVIDHLSQRKFISSPITIASNYFVNNPPGTINSAYAKIFLKALSKQNSQVINVTGEEDLLTLPSILLAPLNSYVIYGQKDLGMIVCLVNVSLKEEICKLLRQFTFSPLVK